MVRLSYRLGFCLSCQRTVVLVNNGCWTCDRKTRAHALSGRVCQICRRTMSPSDVYADFRTCRAQKCFDRARGRGLAL